MARRIQIYPYPLSPSHYSTRSKLHRLVSSNTRRRHLFLPFVLCTILLYYYYHYQYLPTHSYHSIRFPFLSPSLALSLDPALVQHNETHIRLPKLYPLLPSDDPFFNFTRRRPCNQLTLSLSLPPRYNSSTPAEEVVPWISPSPPLLASATLEDRLATFLQSPLSTHAVHLDFNAQTCSTPSITYNTNQLHHRDNVEIWHGLTLERIKEIREETVEVLRTAQKEGRLSVERPVMRGLVWTAGNADTFDRVLVSLRLLRNTHDCHLPAEIFHFPSESPSEDQRREFVSLDAKLISLESLDKEPTSGRTKSFHIKGSAFTSSSFTEILYLDSDSIPTRSPEFLFDSKEFKKFGAVFWPDFWKDGKENAIWRILGIQCRDEWSMESGQVLIDKTRHLDALVLLEHWLKDWRFWFRFSDGDKDLLRYAFLLLRKRWSIPSHTLASASWSNPDELGEANRDKFAGHTMVQFGLASEFEDGKGSRERGRPLFVHGNLLKRIGGDFGGNGGTWSRNLQLHLPSPPLNITNSPLIDASSFEPEWTLSADDLVNISPFTGLGIPHSYSFDPSHERNDFGSAAPALSESSEGLMRRIQGLLGRGLRTNFWDGHRGWTYVLGVQLTWKDELEGISLEDTQASEAEMVEGRPESKYEDWLRTEHRAECSTQTTIRKEALGAVRRNSGTRPRLKEEDDEPEPEEEEKPEGEKGFLQVVDWSEFEELRDFEARFYEAGGRANGKGF
ncbi:uncharacterized protein JCM6883_000015 [Sporobolomyces salmoneus]|uniref:uncharacterized protein n=1 Tax=Sporobolomyces salmoneus TaxID=183962 RepID=UPI00317ADF36